MTKMTTVSNNNTIISGNNLTIAENEQKVYKSGYNKAVKDCQILLKGTASGEIISMKDVSPIEHEMKVKASSKNLFYISQRKTNESYNGLTFNLEAGQSSFIVNGTSTKVSSYTLSRFFLKAGTYTLSLFGANIVTSECDRIYLRYIDSSGTTVYVNYILTNVPKSFTLDDDTEVTIEFIFTTGSIYENKEICIQLEKGTVATTYTPYVADVSAAKVKKYGQNILDIDKGLNECLVKNDDGTYTFTRTANNRFSAKIPFDFPYADCSMYTEIVDTNIENCDSVVLIIDNADKTKNHTVAMRENGNIYGLLEDAVTTQVFLNNTVEAGSYITFKNPQFAFSKTPITNYEPYIEPIEYAISADGTVEGVNSIYPTTTLVPDTNGVLIEAEYNRDINKAFEEMYNAIISLGGNI